MDIKLYPRNRSVPYYPEEEHQILLLLTVHKDNLVSPLHTNL